VSRLRVAAAALLGALVAGEAGAQISPGPLSSAHAELEGMTNCLKCHGIGGENVVDDRCLSCHEPIRWLREEGRGLHALEGAKECRTCHREHGGRDFDVVHWEKGEPESFDHARAGWTLDGKHAQAQCRTCHSPKYHKGPIAAMDDGLDELSWLGMGTSCVECHDDVHKGRLGTSCADCHTTRDFKEITTARFDHDKTRYPLRGKHVSVECVSCHKGGYDPAALPAFADCADCHRDPHGGDAKLAGRAADCAACHDLNGYRPSTYTVARHRDSKYPLEGAHARVACSECHGQGQAKDASGAVRATFRFHPEFARCTDCHDDAHGGQLAARADRGACETCHGVEAFRPSLFQVAQHQALRFPLEGVHEKTACKDCHGPDRRLLPAIPEKPEIGKARVQLRFASLECTQCHRDPHEDRYSAGTELGGDAGCVTCHGFGSFRETNVDVAAHAKYRFPLGGAHAAVPCFECHRDLRLEPPSSLLLAPTMRLSFLSEARICADCHEDPHGGQFAGRLDGGACDICHGSDSFKPASGFDHDEDARFPLEGAHQRVACEKCHRVGPRTDGTEGIVYRPIVPHRCEDCHATKPAPLRETP
jgi:hypothetical protein